MSADKNPTAAEMIETLRLIEKEAAKVLKADDFLTLISHEFRNPVNAVLNYLHLLLVGEYGSLTPEQSHILKQVRTEVDGLSNLIKVSFDLIHADQARRPGKVSQVHLPELLEELEAEVQFLCNSGELSFERKEDSAPPTLWTEPLRLRMALRNLLIHSVKSSEKGRIVLEAFPEKGGAGFRLSDASGGMPDEELSRIFDPASDTEILEGVRLPRAGLGLYLTKRLLELIGGTIEVESRSGVGLTFHVWVPSRKP